VSHQQYNKLTTVSRKVGDSQECTHARTASSKHTARVAKCNLEVRKAESALRHEQRLAEERERRWWAAERHKEPPPAYLQLERVYKSIVKGLKAKLELSEARRVVARAEISLEKAKQVQLEVKHAAELRKLCE